jgi:hypothetical protein
MNPPQVTLTRQTNRSRCCKISSSPLALVPFSSPYRIRTPVANLPNASFISSPYEFDEQFYTNSAILNDNLDVDLATFGAANNAHMKHMRQAHEDIIDSTKLEEFEPIEMPNPPRPIRSHLPDSCKVNDPASYFKYFMGDSEFDMIVTNTNKYADQYSTRHPQSSQRFFKWTNRAEIKVYLTILIFIGIHKQKHPKSHWESPSLSSPV